MSKTFNLSYSKTDGWAEVDVTLSYDFDGTVLNIGDVVSVEISGTYASYDSKNLTSIKLTLYKSYAIGTNTRVASVDVLKIDTNIAPRGEINYSGSFVVTQEIAIALAQSNGIVGEPSFSNMYIGFGVEGAYSSIFNVTTLDVAVYDPTVAPVYNILPDDIVDSTEYKAKFGDMVQSFSNAYLDIAIADIDTGTDANPSGRVYRVSVSIKAPDGTETYASTREIFASTQNISDRFSAIGKFTAYGEYTCTISIRGYYGKTSTSSTTFTVLPYAAPSLSLNGTNPIAKRFRAEQDDYGATVYTEAPDGLSVLTSFIGSIQAFSGLNTFDISLKYGVDGADEMTDAGIVASGTDTDSIVYAYQDTINFLPKDAFTVDNRYQFDITITDYFGQSATITGYVEKAIFRFRITENGVSVGMNSTATADDKRFEVADTHESFFHGGISSFGGGEKCTTSQHALGIQCGYVGAQGNTSSGNYKDTDVTFPTPFAEGCVPVVVVGFHSASSAGTFGRASCSVRTDSATNTGFTIRFFNGDSSNRNPAFSWIAVGQM